ncbi:MAG: Tad domain-containing protein [Phycisphaerae bacterium]
MKRTPPSTRDSRISIKRWIHKLHHNDRGAISVLVLLSIWCLVATLGMLWNLSEISVRRAQVQTAADSAAHTSALWMSRTLNQITAQNMLIVQDASAEVIWRATTPTQNNIDARLQWELARLDAILANQRQLRIQLPRFLNAIKTQYALLQSSLQLIQADVTNGNLSFSDPKAKAAFLFKLRQATYAANWVQTVFVPQLQALVDQVMNEKITQQMLEQARDYIQQEQAILQQMQDHTAPGTSQDVPTLMANDEQAIYQAEQALAATLPSTVNNATLDSAGGSTAISDIYHTDITLATMNNTTGASADVSAPVIPAEQVESLDDLDPINPNTGNMQIGYAPPPLTNPLGVNYNVPGGWGHCWAFPVERDLSARVLKDMQGLQSNYLQPIDTLRRQLALLWAKELGIILNVPALPPYISDDQPDPDTGTIDQIPILPVLTPTGSTGSKTAIDFSYERTKGQYLNDINRLISVLKNYAGLWTIFTQPYAVPQWWGQVTAAREFVLQELGTTKCFMVLQTYKLYPIPDWARPGLTDSLTEAVSWEIFRRNSRLWPLGVQAAFAYINDPQQGYPVNAIVDQMMSRPWPYEKAPPDQPVPPSPGISKPDRINYFTILAAARSRDETTPRMLLPGIFGQGKKLVAFAQAESFNWMEYNDYYGGYATERFDEISTNTFRTLMACPRAWRLSTAGGWNWQPRLSISDGLNKLNGNGANPELAEFLSDVDLKNTDNLVSIH